MDNQDKILKINAELARLELEMELDHKGNETENRHLGPFYDNWFGGNGTENAVGTHKTAFELLLNAVFLRIKEWLDPNTLGCSNSPESDINSVLALFKSGTGKGVTTGHLLIWNCSVADRRFYVLMRVYKKITQYSVVRVDGMGLKDFSTLEYSEGSKADPGSVDLFTERIARAIVKGSDILSIVMPRTSASVSGASGRR